MVESWRGMGLDGILQRLFDAGGITHQQLEELKAILEIVEGRIPSKGQKASSGSVPVVLPSDMGNLLTSVTARETTPAPLSISDTGDNTVLAAPGPGKHYQVFRIVAIVAKGNVVDLILKSGSTELSGAMDADYYVIDYGNEPLICGSDEAFVVNLSAAVAVNGFVQYLEVTE